MQPSPGLTGMRMAAIPYHAQDVDARLGYAHDNWSISTFALYHRSDLSYDMPAAITGNSTIS